MALPSSQFKLRAAAPADADAIFGLVRALADYEKLADAVSGSAEQLKQHLFGTRPFGEAIVAEVDATVIGFALFFYNYSTFLTQPGIYLEDLFVLPDYRGLGIGKALITQVAKRAIEENCGRFEWSVLDWNQPAIDFYQRLGAEVLPDWRICRVTGDRLIQMANDSDGKSVIG